MSRAGQFRHRITFQQKPQTETLNIAREPVETWPDLCTVHAAVEQPSGREWPQLGGRELVAEKRQAETSRRFRIRYRSDITVDRHRIVYAGKTWDIHSISAMPDDRPIELWIEASSIQ